MLVDENGVEGDPSTLKDKSAHCKPFEEELRLIPAENDASFGDMLALIEIIVDDGAKFAKWPSVSTSGVASPTIPSEA